MLGTSKEPAYLIATGVETADSIDYVKTVLPTEGQILTWLRLRNYSKMEITGNALRGHNEWVEESKDIGPSQMRKTILINSDTSEYIESSVLPDSTCGYRKIVYL
jgi:hypothetical protein